MSSARSPRTTRSTTCSRWAATPRHALATAVVPQGAAAQVEETLFQLLAGARACLDREGVALVGGHSGEGELALGLSVTGEVAPDRILRKGGLKTGDALILTRPLGTGVLFAAAMRAKARARWIEAALAEMRRSNRAAAAVLLRPRRDRHDRCHGLRPDRPSRRDAERRAASAPRSIRPAVPLYDGALELARAGIASTLLPENLALAALLHGEVDAAVRALLFDPQTSGAVARRRAGASGGGVRGRAEIGRSRACGDHRACRRRGGVGARREDFRRPLTRWPRRQGHRNPTVTMHLIEREPAARCGHRSRPSAACATLPLRFRLERHDRECGPLG